MTTIKATCPVCGEVSLTPGDIDLHVDSSGIEAPMYAFQCPSCGDVVRKTADERVVRLLISGGVNPETASPEVPRVPHGALEGPALTHDDLLDFHALLERDDWFDLLLSSTPDRP